MRKRFSVCTGLTGATREAEVAKLLALLTESASEEIARFVAAVGDGPGEYAVSGTIEITLTGCAMLQPVKQAL